MGVEWTVKQGDTAPALEVQLRHRPEPGERYGEPMCLDDVDSVTAVWRHEETKTLIGQTELSILFERGDGWVSSPLFPELTARAGLVSMEITAWAHGLERRVPATPRSDYLYMSVRRRLEMADAIVNPNPGPIGVGVIEVTDTDTLPGVFVTPIINLSNSTDANPDGLYRWDGAAYVPASTTATADVDSYIHAQASVSDTWVVVHNLGYIPAGIHIEDAAGNDMAGGVTHDSINQLTIRFAVATDGTARVG